MFRPTPGDFRERYGLQEQTVILGVAYKWTRGKGFDVFATLADALDDSYKVVLVGVTEKQKKRLPPSVICLPRVTNPKELAALYTAADVFVNPTREETLGLTNLEALACGTPVITFDRGGSPECVDETCGKVVPCDDLPALVNAIDRVTRGGGVSPEACRAYASRFNAEDAFGEGYDAKVDPVIDRLEELEMRQRVVRDVLGGMDVCYLWHIYRCETYVAQQVARLKELYLVPPGNLQKQHLLRKSQ